MEYEDFELQIGPRIGEGFQVRVLRSPAGQGEGLLRLPDTAISLASGSGAARGLALLSPAATTPAELGDRLFRALFRGQVGQLFYHSLSTGNGQAGRRGLCIRLRVNPRDHDLAPLNDVPWELLYRADTEDFLALSRATPVVRGLDIPRPAGPLVPSPPLRVLMVHSQAPGEDHLGLAEELKQLKKILLHHPDIEVESLESPDTRVLRRELARSPYHVLHYMGHGAFDAESGEGALLWRGPGNRPMAISGRHLATKIKDFESLCLVVLNACDTARASADAGHSPFAGVATALVLGGVPAVVAMRSPVDDVHAIAFSNALYERLAEGMPLAEAITEGRQAIHSLAPESAAWTVPVLFSRTPSGHALTRRREIEAPSPPLRRGIRITLLPVVVLILAFVVIRWGLAVGWYVDSGEQLVPPNTAALVEPPAVEPQVPAREIVTVSRGTTQLRFEIARDPALPPTFVPALRRASDPLAELLSEQTGAVRWSAIVEPASSSLGSAQPTSQSCRLRAICRVRREGGTVDLGVATAARVHVDSHIACDLAAEALAEAVVRKFAHYVQEELQ